MLAPERFSDLPEYAFPRLRRLRDGRAPGGACADAPVDMTIGEPRHPMPAFVSQVMAEHAHLFAKYPPNEGSPGLRDAIGTWIGRRYGTPADPETEVIALNGTREGLFNAALALCPERKGDAAPKVLVPNPFYLGSIVLWASKQEAPPRMDSQLPMLAALRTPAYALEWLGVKHVRDPQDEHVFTDDKSDVDHLADAEPLTR